MKFDRFKEDIIIYDKTNMESYAELPVDIPRHLAKSPNIECEKLYIDEYAFEEIREFIKTTNINYSELCNAALLLLLSNYVSRNTLKVGILNPKNNGEKTNRSISIFDIDINKELSVRQLLILCKEKMNINYGHQNQVNVVTDYEYDFDNSKFINALILRSEQNPQGGTKEYYQHIYDSVAYDIGFEVIIKNHFLDISCYYNTNIFYSTYIKSILNNFKQTISELLKNYDNKTKTVQIISSIEKNHLYKKNIKSVDYSESLDELFQSQALKHPHEIAVIDRNNKLTYKQLDEKSNQLAHMLVADGIGSNELVPILLDRTVETIIAIFGILKAGGAYTPIDVDYPDSRIIDILKEVKAKRLITDNNNQKHAQDLTNELGYYMNITRVSDALSLSNTRSICNPNSDRVAYTIFTSGTTGHPKGVVVNHKSVLNLINWVNPTYRIGIEDRALLVSPLCFDLSVYDIFGMLTAGGSLYIASNNEIRSPRLLNIIAEQKITFWNSAPAVLRQFMPFFKKFSRVLTNSSLRLIFLSGDWIPIELVEAAKTLIRNIKIVGLGGATEATVWSNYYDIDFISDIWLSVPYGKAINNTIYLILDDDMNLCPRNVPGNLYIGGDCLAEGYLGDVGLTNSRFIDNPFSDDMYPTIYKTGDIARWRTDGNIEFLGRIDNQVKINGYRIELAEIEYKIKKSGIVDQVLIIAVGENGSNKFLCLFYITVQKSAKNRLTKYLEMHLPDYMIPKKMIQLDQFPLTSNGKIDITALKSIAVNHCTLD